MAVGGATSFLNTLTVAGAAAFKSNVTTTGTISSAGIAATGTIAAAGISTTGAISAIGGYSGGSVNTTGSLVTSGTAAIGGMLIAANGLTVRGAPVILPSYVVAALPAASAGALAYAVNGRKPGEAAGAGTGVLVWASQTAQWLSVLGGTVVQA
jgi:hypothetical protein